MNLRTLELTVLMVAGLAVPFVLILVQADAFGLWDHVARFGWTAGAIFAVLSILSRLGYPKSDEDGENGGDEEERRRWRHIRLWQLGLGFGIPLVLFADTVTGDTGDFAVMAKSWAFWPGIAGAGYAGLLGVWRILVAIFSDEDEEGRATTHGSARFATDDEIEKSGLLDPSGVYIGQYPNLTDKGLWYSGDGHLITVASSGSGKGVSAIIPNLLTWEGSVICNDPKGENAAITAKRRREMGQDVYVLNPWGLHIETPWNLKCAAFNPLDLLDTESEDVGDDAAMMANAIIVRGKDPREAHWDDEGEALLTGLILYVAFTEHDPLRRNLLTVRELVTQPPDGWADTLQKMSRAPYVDGAIAETANAFLMKDPKEAASVLSTVHRNTHFLRSNRMRQVLASSDFDLADLKRKPMTIYLCLPFEHVGGRFSRWLRLMITLSLTALARTKGPASTQGNKGVLFLLDEFAALGHMRMAERGMAEGRGYGVKMWPILQDLNQLKDTYKDGWQTFIGNARVVQFFGTADVFTADYVSKMLGKTTVMSSGMSGDRASTSETGRPLMTPDEVMHLGADEELLFVRGVRPIRAEKIPYFHSNLNQYADPNPMMEEHLDQAGS